VTGGWRRPARAAAAAAALLAGCVYFNSVYNARRIFGDAEADRLAGRNAGAQARYDSVVEKAAQTFRKDRSGSWADDALFLYGRASLRRGDRTEARAAFERVVEVTDQREIRLGATLYLGAIALDEGRREEGLRLLSDAINRLPSGPVRAEGHLWRGRSFLESGYLGTGWWDLDRAAIDDPRLRTAVDLERVVYGIATDDSTRARRGVERLLGRDQANVRADTLRRLVRAAADRWGPGPAVGLLRSLEASRWSAEERDRLRLIRTRLLLETGDTLDAVAQARSVAEGFGAEATEARLLLAELMMAKVRRVDEVSQIRPILLPVSGDPRVVERLGSVRKLELLVRRASQGGEPLPLFAAAELARDVLDAPILARRLFLDFARREGSRPWDGKALLAALELADDPEGREEVLRALSRREANPYVRAQRTGWFPAADFERLETRLRSALDDLLVEVTADAAQRDVLLRQRADTLSPGR